MAQLDRAQDSDSWGRRFKSCRVGQKFDKFRLVEFFIHCESNGISSRVSVHIITAGVYHQPQVVLLSQWWYTRLRLDDMQCSALMIYTPLGVIWVQIHRLKRSNIFFIAHSHKISILSARWRFSVIFAVSKLYALRAWYCLRQWYALRALEIY